MSTTPSTKSTQFQSSHDAQSALLNKGTAAKEVRAHEHARHRTKERREHALAKERKEKAAVMRVLGLRVTHGARLARKVSMESWDGEEPAEGQHSVTQDASSVRDVTPGTPAQAQAQTQTDEDWYTHKDDVAPPRDSASPFTVLTLGDLISRPRRPKAKRKLIYCLFDCLRGSWVADIALLYTAVLDFEVIPPIRPVIALDDAEVDEQWEYITRASLNDGSAWKGKSYAQAVASAM